MLVIFSMISLQPPFSFLKLHGRSSYVVSTPLKDTSKGILLLKKLAFQCNQVLYNLSQVKKNQPNLV